MTTTAGVGYTGNWSGESVKVPGTKATVANCSGKDPFGTDAMAKTDDTAIATDPVDAAADTSF